MKKLLQLAVLPLFLGVLMLPGNASAWEANVCYRWTAFPNERIRLVINAHSDLTTWEEEMNFGHPHQVATTVMGKHVGVCGGNTVRTLVGSIIGTDPFDGARLGFETFATTALTCRDVVFSCRVSNLTTWPPPVWNCYSRNDFDVDHPASQLIQVDPTTDPRCSLFESTTFAPLFPELPEPSSGGPVPPVPLR